MLILKDQIVLTKLLSFFAVTLLLISSVTLPKELTGLKSVPVCNCVVFRVAGIQDYFVNEAQSAIMDVFLEKNQTLALGLIMSHIGQDQPITDKVLEGSSKGLFELAVNGWNFTDYSNLSELQQKNSLSKANERMQSLFGKYARIFIPPQESIDASTLNAMRHANMNILSSSIRIDSPNIQEVSDRTNSTIYHVPATTSFSRYEQNGNTTKSFLQEIQNNISANLDKFGFDVIDLEPQLFVDTIEEQDKASKLNNQKIKDLSNLVDFLISTNIPIKTFSDIIGINANSRINQDKVTMSVKDPITNTSLNKVVILTFDDGWESQYTIAKPILDKYGFKTTFFIVCDYVGKNIAGERMDWKDIVSLYNEGYDIQSHTMSHMNLSKVSREQLDFEVGQSKQCLLDKGIKSSIFAYPQNEGSHNVTIVDAVSKDYELARTGEEPLMYLHCDGWKGVSSQKDCSTYFDNGTLTFINRYSIPGWTHNSHSSSAYNSSEMFEKFVEVIRSQIPYNMNETKAVPIITYHNLTHKKINEYDINSLSVDKDLFEAEMKYLYNNGFKVLPIAALEYDRQNDRLFVRNSLPSTGPIKQPPPSSSCITFDSEERIITVTCKKTNLTEINAMLKDPDVLRRDGAVEKGWILNAGIIVAPDSILYINSTDTSWLKIIPDGATSIANGIQVHGNLRIDSVKISSWDPRTNNYVMFEVVYKPKEVGTRTDYDTVARPYIRVEGDATGTSDITNSELAYLGYHEPNDNHGRSGLLYYGGDGSVIKNNHIHHLRFGFYSSGVGNITLEDNLVEYNYMYGFDPHTGTHDMIIRNNTVHDSGAMGIICSLDCYNILIEDNEVYNSTGSGIMFSRNMTDSIARNNYVHNETECLFISASHNNEVSDNRVSNCDNGIYLKAGSSNNNIYNNFIRDTNQGIAVNTGASENEFKSNTIINATGLGININATTAGSNNTLSDNVIIKEEITDTRDTTYDLAFN